MTTQFQCDQCKWWCENSSEWDMHLIMHRQQKACLNAAIPQDGGKKFDSEKPIVKDSGKREHFDSGMVRDTQEGKIDYTTIIDGPMFDRWAEHLTKAKEKYRDIRPGVANWTLASGEEELVRFRKSAFRHFRQWLRGDTDEDHAAAVFFNINGFEYVKKKII